MERTFILVIAIGFFLGASHLLVQSLPIKYHERNLNVKTPSYTRKHPNKKIIDNRQATQKQIKDSDDQKSATEDALGWAMFPIPLGNAGGNKIPSQKGKFSMFPKIAHTNETVDKSTRAFSTAKSKAHTEMTVSVPVLKTDKVGNIVFDKLFANNKDTLEDSQQKEYYRGTPSTVKFRAPERPRMYSPGHRYGLSTVCRKRSTVYNVPNIFQYLRPRIYNRVFSFRAVWMDLREEIWKEGNSQECHQANMTDWLKYINCAIRRNMRMDYLVPMYPLHQQGYYFHPDIKFYRLVK
ncbi:uncharacterized protein LOC110191149 [Drosophila serrata]|uniref:uncharacterized protein LOC110191149 n=1 Tax=Drosophila serrata TaxID=7274 RepID=UPI000A1D1684|nr:uncharacterized protein LOC110191149 [Drosophila serrata]